MRAMEWLLHNNEEWRYKSTNLDEVRQNLRNPALVMNAVEEESENANIESTESFAVYFPDGTMSSTNGGQQNIDRFKDLVHQATASGFDLEVRSDLYKKATSDFKDNNLVNACLLQYPYGRGGMNEVQMKEDGSLSQSINQAHYADHLSRVSQSHFHHQLFTLTLFNLTMKQRMIQSASWRVRDKAQAMEFATELTEDDVD